MTKKYLKSMAAVLVAVVLLATPVMGAVCTMSCGDSGTCCCKGGTANGELFLSAPNCCEGELRHNGRSDALGERTYRSVSIDAEAVAPVEDASSSSPFGRDDGGAVANLPVLRPPPSPLFILNASFLI